MRKTMLLAALTLTLGGVAGAQTGCVQPSISSLPRLNDTGLSSLAPWDGDTRWSSQTIGGTGGSTAAGTGVQGFFTSVDYAAGRENYSVFYPNATSEQVRYMKLMTKFSNNLNGSGTRGVARTVEISYAGVVYARIETSPSTTTVENKEIGFIYAMPGTGAQIFDKNGQPATQTDIHNFAPPGAVGIRSSSTGGSSLALVGAGQSTRLTDSDQFFLLLPANIPATGTLALTNTNRDPNPTSSTGLIDDIVVYKPETVPTTFCLEKTAVGGAPLGTYDFTTTERNAAAKSRQIVVPTADTPVRQANAYQVVGDYVDVRELTAGTYGISSIRCQSDVYQNPNGTSTPYLVRPETAVATITTIPGETGYTSPLGSKNFRVAIPSGTQTVCRIVNDGTLPGRVTTNKTFPGGRSPAADQATITLNSGANTVTYGTTGAGTAVGYTVTDSQRVISPPTTYTVPPASTAQDPITVAGTPPKLLQSVVTASRDNDYTVTASEAVTTPANYSSSYSCADAGGTARISGTGTSLSVTGVRFGDDITCTFVNTSLVAPPTVSITKDGATYVTAGSRLTYTITVNNTSGVVAEGVTITDTLPGNVTFVSASDGGVASATGDVTWNLGTLPAQSSRTVTVTVTAPATRNRLGSTIPGEQELTPVNRTLTNTAKVSTTTPNASQTATATKESWVLFAGVTKQVRNVTRNTALGLSSVASPGDILEYCLGYTNYSSVPLNQLTVSDTLNAGQTLLPGAYSAQALSVTRAGVTTPGANEAAGAGAVSKQLTDVAAGETGQVCFQVQVSR